MLGAWLFLVAVGSLDGSLQDVAVLSLSPLDGRAVVRTAKRELVVVRVGDELPESDARLRQVLPDRLVLEIAPKGSPKKTIWLYRAEKPGGASRVVVLDRETPDRKPVLQPGTPAPPKPDVKHDPRR